MSGNGSEVLLPVAGLERFLLVLRLSLRAMQRLPQQPQSDEGRSLKEGAGVMHLRGHYWYPGAGAIPLPLCRKAGILWHQITPEVMVVGCPECLELIELLITKKLAVLIGLKSKKLLAVPTFGGHPYNQHPDLKPLWSGTFSQT